jgi:hypothetical protein
MKFLKLVAGYDHKAKEEGQKELNTARPQLYAPTFCFFHEFMHLFPIFVWSQPNAQGNNVFPDCIPFFFFGAHKNKKSGFYSMYNFN